MFGADAIEQPADGLVVPVVEPNSNPPARVVDDGSARAVHLPPAVGECGRDAPSGAAAGSCHDGNRCGVTHQATIEAVA